MEEQIKEILWDLLRTVERDQYLSAEELVDRALTEIMDVIDTYGPKPE